MIKNKQHTFKIVLTGPESSGKSEMARALHTNLPTAALVPEFARYYLAHLGRPYTRQDLTTIGRGQQQWEKWHARQKPQWLICDTDWTVLQVWEHYRFGCAGTGNWDWQAGYRNPRPADLYLLCRPDFPWQPDPLREHPNQREELFQWYTDLLDRSGARYFVLNGPHPERLAAALMQVQNLFPTLPAD